MRLFIQFLVILPLDRLHCSYLVYLCLTHTCCSGRWARKVSESSIVSEEDTGVDYTEDFASETLSVAKDSDRTEKTDQYTDEEEDETETSETLR